MSPKVLAVLAALGLLAGCGTTPRNRTQSPHPPGGRTRSPSGEAEAIRRCKDILARHGMPNMAVAVSRDTFVYHGGDGAEAAKVFKEFLERHGLKVLGIKTVGLGFHYADLAVLVFMEPNAAFDQLDRIVLAVSYDMDPKQISFEKLRPILARLSNMIGNPTCHLHERVLTCRTALTYLDVLPWKEFEATLHWFTAALRRILPEMAPALKQPIK